MQCAASQAHLQTPSPYVALEEKGKVRKRPKETISPLPSLTPSRNCLTLERSP